VISAYALAAFSDELSKIANMSISMPASSQDMRTGTVGMKPTFSTASSKKPAMRAFRQSSSVASFGGKFNPAKSPS